MTMHGHTGGASKEGSLRTAMLTGLLDTGICLVAMLAARSTLLMADFLKTLLEFIAVGLSWLAIRRIARGGAQQFDYGLGKMENLVSLAVGLLMATSLVIIIGNSVHNLLHPSHVSGIGMWIGWGDQVLYMAVNGALCARSYRAARREASPLLQSQARLLLTRTVGNVFIFLSLTLSMTLQHFAWSQYIDPLASLVVAGSILMAAMGIFSASVSDLLDRTLEESDQLSILRELTRHFDDYEFLHGIRSRRSGSNVFIEILLEFDADKKVGEVQAVIDHLRRSIEEKVQNSRVTIGLSTGPVSAPVEEK